MSDPACTGVQYFRSIKKKLLSCTLNKPGTMSRILIPTQTSNSKLKLKIIFPQFSRDPEIWRETLQCFYNSNRAMWQQMYQISNQSIRSIINNIRSLHKLHGGSSMNIILYNVRLERIKKKFLLRIKNCLLMSLK